MYCKHCASEIDDDVIVCPKCGKQVQELKGADNTQPQNIIINNSATSSASASATAGGHYGSAKSKMTAIILCCLGFVGIGGLHKFYEGKTLMGILYLCTFGLFFIGTVLDLINLLGKPDIYYV